MNPIIGAKKYIIEIQVLKGTINPSIGNPLKTETDPDEMHAPPLNIFVQPPPMNHIMK
jgi:hypothetical protein